VDVLEVSTIEGRIYSSLIAHPGLTDEQIAAVTSLPANKVRDVLASLAEAGLAISETSGGEVIWEPTPPDLTVDKLLEAREQRLMEARKASQQLTRLYWMARRETSRYAALEVVLGDQEYATRFANLVSSATTEIRSCNRPPFLTPLNQATLDKLVDEHRSHTHSGVTIRSIWWNGLLDDPIVSEIALRMMEAGERSRVLPLPLPLKAIIADDRLAMIHLETDDYSGTAHLVVYPSSLLNLLIGFFDTLWELSIPLSHEEADATDRVGLTERERTILTMMAAGATDTAIARRLGLSQRTVLRQVTYLCRRLGAHTRFQAGMQAARRGWI
jgi:DNA-binding CsgD family transcriptional regulator